MKKNRIISIAIVLFLAVLPFQFGYMYLSEDSQFLQVMCMSVVIIGSVYAVYKFNQDPEGHH